jgi:hypothetical protein
MLRDADAVMQNSAITLKSLWQPFFTNSTEQIICQIVHTDTSALLHIAMECFERCFVLLYLVQICWYV